MNNKAIKQFTIGSIIFLVIALTILAMGQIDYNISKSLINRESLWAEFFNLFGEIPAYLGLLVSTVILLGGRKKTNKIWNIIAFCIGSFFTIFFSYSVIFIPVHYIFEFEESGIPKNISYIVLIVGLVLGLVLIFLANKNNEKLNKLKKQALFIITLVVLETLTVNVLKMAWARPRMRSITSFEEFNYWYQIAGWANDSELKSFPSGHTANSFCILAFYVFLPYFKRIKPSVFLAFGVAWGTCVAISRVVLGAHFLSDVLVGGYVTIFLFLVLNHLFFKNTKV